jgi:hypothetical protein
MLILMFRFLSASKQPQQGYGQCFVQVLAILVFLAFSAQAKAQSSDFADMKILGQISTVTCSFVITTDPVPTFLSQHNPSLTLDLGTTTLSDAKAVAVGSTFGDKKTIFLFTRQNGNASCDGGPTFDIGLSIPSNKVIDVGTKTFLQSNGSDGKVVAQGVALSLVANHRSILKPNTNILDDNSFLNLRKAAADVGPLLSGNQTLKGTYDDKVKGLGNNRLFALTAQFVKTSEDMTPGIYTTNITVNLWWR